MADNETPKAPAPKTARWVRVLLVASLALNLVVAGVVAGAVWRHGPGDHVDRRPASVDRISLPYIRALDDVDKRAIRDGIRAQMPDRAARRAQLETQFSQVLEALRADPYDPARLTALIDDQFAGAQVQQDIGRALMLERIAAMDSAARTGFADRLEAVLQRIEDRRAHWAEHRDGRDD